MAGIADMLVQAGLQTSTQSADLAGASAQGAKIGLELGQTILNAQNQRAQLEQRKQELDLMKLDKVTGMIETGLTKVPKKAQKSYFEGIRNNVAGKLNVGLTDEFFAALTSPDVNQGAVGQAMVDFRAAVREGMETGDFSKAAEMAPNILEAFGGDATKFGDFMNTAMGSEANAKAQAMRLQFDADKIASEPDRAAKVQIKKNTSDDRQDYQLGGKATFDSNLNKLEEAAKKLETGKVKTGQVSAAIPFLGSDEGQDILNPATAAIRDDVRGAVQSSLRQIMGPQFTEKEGTAIFNRAFNPRLSGEENARRIRAEAQRLRTMDENKRSEFAAQGMPVPAANKKPWPGLPAGKREQFKKLSKSEQDKAVKGLVDKYDVSIEQLKKDLGL